MIQCFWDLLFPRRKLPCELKDRALRSETMRTKSGAGVTENFTGVSGVTLTQIYLKVPEGISPSFSGEGTSISIGPMLIRANKNQQGPMETVLDSPCEYGSWTGHSLSFGLIILAEVLAVLKWVSLRWTWSRKRRNHRGFAEVTLTLKDK